MVVSFLLTNVIPVYVAYDDGVDVLGRIKTTCLKTCPYIDIELYRLPLRDVMLLSGGIAGQVPFKTKIKHQTLWSALLCSRVLDEEGKRWYSCSFVWIRIGDEQALRQRQEAALKCRNSHICLVLLGRW